MITEELLPIIKQALVSPFQLLNNSKKREKFFFQIMLYFIHRATKLKHNWALAVHLVKHKISTVTKVLGSIPVKVTKLHSVLLGLFCPEDLPYGLHRVLEAGLWTTGWLNGGGIVRRSSGCSDKIRPCTGPSGCLSVENSSARHHLKTAEILFVY